MILDGFSLVNLALEKHDVIILYTWLSICITEWSFAPISSSNNLCNKSLWKSIKYSNQFSLILCITCHQTYALGKFLNLPSSDLGKLSYFCSDSFIIHRNVLNFLVFYVKPIPPSTNSHLSLTPIPIRVSRRGLAKDKIWWKILTWLQFLLNLQNWLNFISLMNLYIYLKLYQNSFNQ